MEPELTGDQIERQDIVDSKIVELLQELVPAIARFEWDIHATLGDRD